MGLRRGAATGFSRGLGRKLFRKRLPTAIVSDGTDGNQKVRSVPVAMHGWASGLGKINKQMTGFSRVRNPRQGALGAACAVRGGSCVCARGPYHRNGPEKTGKQSLNDGAFGKPVRHGAAFTAGGGKPPADRNEGDALFLAGAVTINVGKEYQNSTAHGKGNEAGKGPSHECLRP